MNLKKIKIRGTDKNRDHADVCNVVMTYELIEFDATETAKGAESYAVLHRVQLEPSEYSTLIIDAPLHDEDAREHFELMLSANLHGYRVGFATTTQELAKQFLEVST